MKKILLFSAVLLLPSCAILSSEIHLAPVFSIHRTAQGGSAWEAMGGILGGVNNPKQKEFAIHPIFRTAEDEPGVVETDFLYPLGYGRQDGVENFWRFFPIYWWKDHVNEKGEHDIDWIFFPFFGGTAETNERYFAVFPLFGTLRDYLSYDRIRFFLFPLYSDTQKAGGRKSTNILWPIFGWASGNDQSSFRFFPVYSHSDHDGRYSNYSVLWPFIHFGWTDLDKEHPGFHFLFLFLFGWSDENGLKSWAVLPPFGFGHSENEKTGYSAYDILWPLIKIVRGGKSAERTRFLPFYADFSGEEIQSQVYLWPICWIRKEKATHYSRDSLYVIPFWHSWRKKDDKEVESGYWQAWPFAHHEWSSTGEGDFAFPSPALFRHKIRGIDENFAVLWTLYRNRTGKEGESSTRVFADLYRRESGHGEDRLSVPLLFGRRIKQDGSVEWSFLAGLLRFHSTEQGTSMMAPSFPGPGWED